MEFLDRKRANWKRNVLYTLLLMFPLLLAACTNTNSLRDELSRDDIQSQATNSFERRVSADSDDAEEAEDGTMHLGSSDLDMILDSRTDRGNQKIGVRFTDINIPNNTTITNAYIQFTVEEETSVSTTVGIRAIDQNNAPTFSTSTNIRGRSKTSAGVTWTVPSWNTVGASGSAQRTPNLKNILQELVDRDGWSSGNAVSFVIANGGGERVAESHDGNSAKAPLLYVEYENNSSVTSGADYFVAINGSDSNSGTTVDSPFATLQRALTEVGPGDTVHLRGGVYVLDGNDYIDVNGSVASGQSGNPITIESFPNERAIIDGSGLKPTDNLRSDGKTIKTSKPELFTLDEDWYVIRNLTFRYGAGRAVVVTGNHNVVSDVISHSHHSDGIYVQGDYNTFERIESYNNFNYFGKNTNPQGYTPQGDSADGIKMANPATGNVIRYFRAYNNSDDGIDIFSANNTTVEYSISYRNGRGDAGDGNGYKLGGRLGGNNMDSTNNIAKFNLAYDNDDNNFDYNNSKDIKMFGNTAYDSGPSRNNFVFGRNENVAKCNLSYGGDLIDGTPDQSYKNSWDLNGSDRPVPETNEGASDFLSVGSDANISPDCNVYDIDGQQISTSYIGALEPGKTLSDPPFDVLPPETCEAATDGSCDKGFWRPSKLR